MSEAQKQRSRSWIVIALAVSLALNLLLVGFVGGRALRPPGPPPGDPSLGALRWAEELSESRRAALQEPFDNYRRTLRRDRAPLRRHHVAVHQALRQDDFEPDKLLQALNQRQLAVNDRRLASHQAFVDLLEALTAEERRALHQYMRSRGRAFRQHRSANAIRSENDHAKQRRNDGEAHREKYRENYREKYKERYRDKFREKYREKDRDKYQEESRMEQPRGARPAEQTPGPEAVSHE